LETIRCDRFAFATKENGAPFATLLGRKMQVLRILEGINNQQISERLCLSPKTVNTYRARLQENLGIFNDIKLLRLAACHGLVALHAARGD